jgi:threonine dehydrogenase-like Zn-dependent dehydrogenase
MEGHAHGAFGGYDLLKQTLLLETDRPTALRQALLACRNGGTVSIPGVYGGFLDKVPFGAVVNKALTVRSGQTHVQRYMRPLLELIERGSIDPSFVVTHRLRLEEAPRAYRMFRDKQDSCIKVVLKPWADVPTVEADKVEETGRILH